MPNQDDKCYSKTGLERIYTIPIYSFKKTRYRLNFFLNLSMRAFFKPKVKRRGYNKTTIGGFSSNYFLRMNKFKLT